MSRTSGISLRILLLWLVLPISCPAMAASATKEKRMQTIDQVVTGGPFQATWESLQKYTVPEWYLDAKFGIFIHWGVYAVPAFGSEWYPRNMYKKDTPEFAHHVATFGPQKTFGYKDF